MSIDFERLDAALTYGFEHPEEFDMHHWFTRPTAWRASNFCGTTACLAGTAAIQDGWSPIFATGVSTASYVGKGDRVEHVEDVAAKLLGFDDEDQLDIFGVVNITRVIEIRNEWARKAGVPERSWDPSAARVAP